MKNPNVDILIQKSRQWQEEFSKLRSILLEFPMTEEVKWGVPCYTLGKSNVVLIHGFKEYCALLFFKGVLLKDPEGILIRQTENVQSSRQLRFSGMKDILKQEKAIRKLVAEAIEAEKAGMKVEFRKTREYSVPEEFQSRLEADPELKKAFDALTPGRQRAYLLFFTAPKQAKTRVARVEKCVPAILRGKGLLD
jgi:uncharacterized protein YdeI (YjbR/CyaY-like superfamily)